MANEKRLIDLDSVIEQLEHEWGYEGMREDLYKLPTVDAVEVVHGWWDKKKDEKFIGYDADGKIKYRTVYSYYCGRCALGTAVKTNYCPHCGAKMDL